MKEQEFSSYVGTKQLFIDQIIGESGIMEIFLSPETEKENLNSQFIDFFIMDIKQLKGKIIEGFYYTIYLYEKTDEMTQINDAIAMNVFYEEIKEIFKESQLDPEKRYVLEFHLEIDMTEKALKQMKQLNKELLIYEKLITYFDAENKIKEESIDYIFEDAMKRVPEEFLIRKNKDSRENLKDLLNFPKVGMKRASKILYLMDYKKNPIFSEGMNQLFVSLNYCQHTHDNLKKYEMYQKAMSYFLSELNEKSQHDYIAKKLNTFNVVDFYLT